MLKKEPEKEKFFTAVQTGQNAISLYGTSPPANSVRNANRYWFKQKEDKLDVQTTKILRERKYGKFEGKPNKEYDKVKKILEKLTDEERYSYKMFGIESDKEIVERLINFLKEIAISYPGKKILVVTHGAVMRFFLIKLGVGNHRSLRPGAVKSSGFIKLQTNGTDFLIKELSKIQFSN